MFPLSLLCSLLLSLAAQSVASSTTPFDPFHALAVHAPRPTEPPVCRLTPLPALDTVEGDVILSFEEWKVKQFALEAEAKVKDAANRSAHAQSVASVAAVAGDSSDTPPQAIADDQLSSHSPPASAQELTDNHQIEKLSPHFRVPLTDRFNYANLDCSRVHTSHQSAKSPSAILSSKRDKYMLSPCVSPKAGPQYVIVELCEDIRIDTVQLANFEFFSGVFKDFTVSVAKTYTTDAAGWTKAGTYRAKNVRGVQSFHPPTSLRDFYRYIRIDFHSHYGNEYYCPVSLLRVYGLTHLEEWKWDVWEAESRSMLHQKEAEAAALPSVTEDIGSLTKTVEASVVISNMPSDTTEMSAPSDVEHEPDSATLSTPLPESHTTNSPFDFDGSDTNFPAPSVAPDLEKLGDFDHSMPVLTCDSQDHMQSPVSLSTPHDTDENLQVIDDTMTTSAVPISEQTQDVIPVSETPTPAATLSETILSPPSQAANITEIPIVIATTSVNIEHSPRPSSSSIPIHSPSIPIPPSPPPISTGGESIYRTIMNRLTALEANHTLYMRYVEEQTASVRDVLRRLGEDVGRVEAIGKSQAQLFQRTLQDWERHRNRLDTQCGELVSRVEYLAAEIVLEKRLGIAQLCLLLVVLVFMGLTRGEARLDLPPPPSSLRDSVTEWGRRNLSFSNSWMGKLTSQSRSNTPVRKPAPLRLPDGIDFPSSQHTPEPLRTVPLRPSKRMNVNVSSSNLAGGRLRPKARSRSSTPSLRTPVSHPYPFAVGARSRQVPATPSGGRAWPMQRANSHCEERVVSGELGFGGSGGGVPRSARRWARSAHLHEVRGSAGKVRKRDDDDEVENVDVFAISPMVKKVGDKRAKMGMGKTRTRTEREAEEWGEEDVWEDTDVDADNSEVDGDVL